ncbi:MAG: Gfo/Idh/MocA family oxidoreductase [Calothrix sp. MO_192.B10]|nr:Gfo/Idh/MocA family oxidoreductase [Calothrix sp. MO_192.B10]
MVITTNSLNSNLQNLKNGNHTEQVTKIPVTIVGYGRYGNQLLGPKYAESDSPWEVKAIIDPQINLSQFQNSVLGKKQPNTLLCGCFSDWFKDYFSQMTEDEKSRQVIEFALKPHIVYEQAMNFISIGIKAIILPKPVVINHQQLHSLSKAVKNHRVKAAVSSQWYYSDLPKIICREWQRIAKSPFQGFRQLHRVEVNYSKENGRAYQTPPPLLELPHALQIITSSGLMDFEEQESQVKGGLDEVEVIFYSEQITEGVHILSEIDMKPPFQIKRKYSDWDVQERSLKLYFSDSTTIPSLEVDFWIKFDSSGTFALRPGQIIIRDSEASGDHQLLKLNFVEDQLRNMNYKIYKAFDQDFFSFQSDASVLSLERYKTIGQQIMDIQQKWSQLSKIK